MSPSFRSVYASLLGRLCAVCLLLSGSCGSASDETSPPVVVVTLRGLTSAVTSLRVQAWLQARPAKADMQFQPSLNPSSDEYPFAVRLPPGSRGTLRLSIQALSADACDWSDAQEVHTDVSPGQVLPLSLDMTLYPRPRCPLRLRRTGQVRGLLTYESAALGCTAADCRCADTCELRVPQGSLVRLSAPSSSPLCFLGFDGGGCQGLTCELTVDKPTEITGDFATCERTTPFLAEGGGNLSVVATATGVWVGSEGSTRGSGLHRLDRQTGIWQAFSTDYKAVSTLWADASAQYLWMAAKIPMPGLSLIRLSEQGAKQDVAISISAITKLWGRGIEEMWMLNSDIYPFDSKGYKSGSRPNFDAIALAPADESQLWLVGEGGGIARGTPGTWQSMPKITAKTLFDIWSIDAENAWAVGEAGTTLRWNGREWSVEPSGVSQALRGVWGSSPGNVWAVGENTVLYWNGRVWTRMQAGLQHYTDIHGDDGRHFWAVDAGGGVTSFTR